jgi:hypothetical protein
LKRIIALFAILVASAFVPIHAENWDRVKPTVTLDATTDSVLISGNGYATAGFQITGTWSGTIKFFSTVNGTTWVAAYATNSQTRASDTTATENGLYLVSLSGTRHVKAQFTAYTSGPAVIYAISTDDPISTAGASGGGGGAEGSVDVLSIAAGNNNIGNVDVVTLPALVAGSANIGDVDVATIAAGDNNIGNVDVVTLPALPSGTNNIGDVDIASIAAGNNNIGDVDIASSALPALASTSTKQSDGSQKTQIVDGSGNVIGATSNSLNVNITGGAGSGGTSATDDAAFTPGSGSGTPMMGLADNESPDAVNEGDVGVVRMTGTRILMVNMRDSSGNELATGAQYKEDTVHTSGDYTTLMGVVRKDTPVQTAGTDGDVSALVNDANGRLHTNVGVFPDNEPFNVAQINGVTPLMGAGNTGTGSPRVTIATDQATLPVNPGTAANWGVGATGSAVPANAEYAGANSAGNLTGIIQPDSSAIINMSTATTTQIVGLTSAKKIFIAAWDVVAAGTGTIKLVYGTGTDCGTGTTDLTPAYSFVANAGIAKGMGFGVIYTVPASNALCVTTSAAVGMQGTVSYTKF